MDPISAIGVAAAIGQFIDFCSNLLSKDGGLYSASKGPSRAKEELGNIVNRLKLYLAQLNEYPLKNAPQSESEKSLERLCMECQEVAKELLDGLEKLGVRSKNTMAFRQAYKMMWRESEMERLVQRLQRMRDSLNTQLQLQMAERNIQQSLQFQQLDSERQTLVQALANSSARHADNSKGGTQSRELQDRAVAISLLNRESTLGKALPAPELISSITARLKAQKELLKLLSFPVMTDRYEGIVEAHSSTFEWVFESKPSGWSSLPDWLSKGPGKSSGIYWIKGEPATGKSTMMKLIFDSPKTRNFLKPWVESQALTTAAFFFWNSGSAIERSQSGLLRSLLYTVLNRQPELLPVVLTDRWTTLYSRFARPTATDSPEIRPWSQEELYRAFKDLVAQVLVPLKLFLLVDGLDEYDGDQAEIVSLFQEISSSSNVKAIVSSRPFQAIEDAFGKGPHLSLQNLNHDDIRLFVDDTLNGNTTFQRVMLEDAKSTQEVIDLVVKQANGVFLPAQLAVMSLRKELSQSEGHDLQTIKDKILSKVRLQSLHADMLGLGGNLGVPTLHEVFNRAWQAIPSIYHSGASQTLQIMQAARAIRNYSVRDSGDGDPLMLIDLVLADGNAEDIVSPNFRPLDEDEIQLRCTTMANRLELELPGFVVVHTIREEGVASVGPHSRVQYSHRSARDYVDDIAASKLLEYTTGTPFNPYLSLIQSSVQHLKILNRHGIDKRILLRLLWYFVTASLLSAHHFEQSKEVNSKEANSKELNSTYVQLLDSLDKTMRLHHIKNLKDEKEKHWLDKQFVLETTVKKDKGWAAERDSKLHWTNFHPDYPQPKEWENDFLSLVVQFGLSKYLNHTLAAGDRLLKAKRGRPLLDYAMSPLLGLDYDLITKDLVKVLIEHGADPNEEFDKSTCWQNALLWLHKQFPASIDGTSTLSPKAQKIAETRLEIFKLLIEKGASVNACVKTDKEEISLATVSKNCFHWCTSFAGHEQLVAASQTAKTRFFSMNSIKKISLKKKV